tara:strand:+ start:4969 stop:6123 length:1155 start_codon:yes stop_codon:yes gene_type:complete
MGKEIQIPVGSTLGMIAGGQIGGFFTEAALRMGYKVAVWDPDKAAPAKRFASIPLTGSFDDPDVLNKFQKAVSGVSIEWENVPSNLIKGLEKHVIVRPGSRSLELAQDRIKEKTFLEGNNFPITPFYPIQELSQISEIDFDFPWIIKTATLGYDGHGQWYVANQVDIDTTSSLQNTMVPMVVEKVVKYKRELSVVIVIDEEANCISYPPTENLHQGGILKMSISPARITDDIKQKAIKLGRNVIQAIGDSGVFCVEMFQTQDDELLVNEIAPRPHNSGHHTIDAFSISQYEHQVRVLAGLPLREPVMLSKSVLLNVLGDEYTVLSKDEQLYRVLDSMDAKIYLYGKTSVRPGRKMGHIMFCGDSLDELLGQADYCQSILAPEDI